MIRRVPISYRTAKWLAQWIGCDENLAKFLVLIRMSVVQVTVAISGNRNLLIENQKRGRLLDRFLDLKGAAVYHYRQRRRQVGKDYGDPFFRD